MVYVIQVLLTACEQDQDGTEICLDDRVLCRRSSTQSDINHVPHCYNNSLDDGLLAARNM
jgi:hypothetical protein